MILDDFSNIPNGTAIDDAPEYELQIGSPANMTFVTGIDQPIELSISTSEGFARNITDPHMRHQSVQSKFRWGSVVGSTAYTGVFARYADANNYVLARVDHNAFQAELIERIAGVNTMLISLAITSSLATVGGSIRMELIGSRARLFFEPNHREIQDCPPDAAVTLAGVYSDAAPGDWGLYSNSNDGSNTMRIQSFLARDLPSAVMPAPSVLVESATGMRFAPISATTTLTADIEFEWEVFAADADDYAEAYRQMTPPTVTSVVFWVRQGFTYFIRVRAINLNGVPGDWEVSDRVTAAGSKASTVSPTLPDDTFPDVFPSYVMKWNPSEVKSGAIVTTTGRPKIVAGSPRPRHGWNLRFDNRSKAELLLLKDFFHEMHGILTPFQWTHPASGTVYAVRFGEDQNDFTPIDQIEDDDAVASIEMPIVEVITGAISILTFAIELDPVLYTT